MRTLAVGIAVLAGAIVLAAMNFAAIVDHTMTPSARFAEETPPPAPDYSKPESWSALPDPSSADAVDVFYIHPTSYVGSRWNGPIDDADLNAATDRVATGIQAPAFESCCAIYGPRYRQANGSAFYRSSEDGDRAIAFAYEDVKRAFAAFNARRGAGRPFILAAHSQGAIHAERLLFEVIAGSALEKDFVAGYLIGGRLTYVGLKARAPNIHVCGTPNDIGCIAAWNARGPHFQPTRFEMVRADKSTRVCVNPLTWRDDEQPAPASENLGAVFLETEDRVPKPAFADAQCKDGVLVVSAIGEAPRDLPSRILDRMLGEENYHPIEYQIFFENVRENAAARTTAFLGARRPSN